MNNSQKIDNPEIKVKKKKVKKVKPPKPIYNEYVYSPALQTTKPITQIVGFIGRMLTVYIGVLGMTIFLTDAFKVEINIPALMLVTLAIVGVFSVMAINKLMFFCGLGVTVLTAAILAVVSGNPLSAFMNSVGTLWNHMLDRLDFVGYKISTSLYLPVDTTTIFTEEQTASFMFGGVVFVTVIFAVIFTASIIKRIHILPLLITGAIVITTVFTYNISSSNWGFSLIVTAVAGIITLKIYDSIYNRKKPARDIQTNSIPKGIKTAAYGGTAGLVTMALSFIILLIPTLTCKEQWTTIGFINDKMEYGRALVSSVILGETPDVDLGFIGNMDTLNPRSTEATERIFTGREMIKVYASYNMPLYVRSWIATSYSDDDNAWVSVSSSKAAQYSSWFYNGFTPEVINYNFFNMLNPKNTNINSFTSYSNHIEDGYITETIDIQNLNSAGNLLYTVATYNPSYGLLNFLSTDRADLYEGEWKFYYEGIVTSSWFNLNKQYRMTSFVPSYRYETYSESLANNLQYYSLMKYFVTQYADISTTDAQEAEAVQSAKEMLSYYGVEYDEPIALERYFEQDEAGRANFLYTYFTLPDYYQSFVLNEYLATPKDSKYLSDIANKITQDYLAANGGLSVTSPDPTVGEQTENIYAGTVTDESVRHNVVLSVIDYLKDNYRYTLTPKAPKNSRLSALDAFLGDAKEGYCVQFATSAAMILREMGIPTRYCEGYLVNNLKYDKTPERLAKYSQTVRDYNAHSWIEVYMGAAGWMVYETTPEYYSDLYEPYLSSSGTISYTPPEESEYIETTTMEEILETEPEEPKGFKLSAKALFTIILCVICAGLIAIPIWLIVRLQAKSVRAYEKRYAALNRAMQSQMTEDELRETSREINDYIWQLHEVAGVLPEKGELPAEYCDRVDDNINASMFSFNDILSYMNREEFGYGMTRWQLREEAEYTQILWDKIQQGMTGLQKLRYRFWKRMA